MAKFVRGSAPSIGYIDGVRAWDFSMAAVVTEDEALVAILLEAGAVEIEDTVAVPADPNADKMPMTIIDEVAGMTKVQLADFAMDRFGVEIVVSSNKTKDEMLVELQAAADAKAE